MDPVIIIGAGHNGLVTAFYLARAGYRPLVLERRGVVGGASITEELAPGHKCPILAHTTGPVRPSIVRDMHLERRVEFLRPETRLVALSTDGPPLVMSRDVGRTKEAIRAFSPTDAEQYPEFCSTLERLAAFLLPILERTPPSIDAPASNDLWELLRTGQRFRALGRTDAYRLLRWMPMPVADLVAEWFSTDLLQAAIAARSIFGTAMGPWSAGTGAVLLLDAAMDPAPGGSSVSVKGGPGALTKAMADAAREAGATIRVDAPVAKVLVRDGRASGVILADGTEIPARAVVSNADPRRTMLDLIDPLQLDPGFLQRIRNYRMPGTVAKINMTLTALPTFDRVTDSAELNGRIHIGPSVDYLEKAFDASKYGEISREPYLDVTIPSLIDPSLCPPGRHVMSICLQFAPYRLANNGDWNLRREELATIAMRTIERYSPGISNIVDHRQVLTPTDLEETFALTRGHILHGEPALDQLFTMRPVLGWAKYRTPIDGLFLCGAGTHPAGGITGASGKNAASAIIKYLKK